MQYTWCYNSRLLFFNHQCVNACSHCHQNITIVPWFHNYWLAKYILEFVSFHFQSVNSYLFIVIKNTMSLSFHNPLYCKIYFTILNSLCFASFSFRTENKFSWLSPWWKVSVSFKYVFGVSSGGFKFQTVITPIFLKP